MTTANEPDRIFIRDLSVMGIIGINPEERVTPQEVLVNATLWVDSRQAAKSDDIADSVNYRTVTKAMIAHIEAGTPMLVERLAAELAEVCLGAAPGVRAVEVTVEKPGALRHARSVGITVRRSRVASDEEV
jgi:dihydroneopterin aldolase/D-erythro-7,8-dihydroneopterin triphosphate epimerase